MPAGRPPSVRCLVWPVGHGVDGVGLAHISRDLSRRGRALCGRGHASASRGLDGSKGVELAYNSSPPLTSYVAAVAAAGSQQGQPRARARRRPGRCDNDLGLRQAAFACAASSASLTPVATRLLAIDQSLKQRLDRDLHPCLPLAVDARIERREDVLKISRHGAVLAAQHSPASQTSASTKPSVALSHYVVQREHRLEVVRTLDLALELIPNLGIQMARPLCALSAPPPPRASYAPGGDLRDEPIQLSPAPLTLLCARRLGTQTPSAGWQPGGESS